MNKATVHAFLEVVKQLRKAQKAYFRSRKRDDLIQAKRLVDVKRL